MNRVLYRALKPLNSKFLYTQSYIKVDSYRAEVDDWLNDVKDKESTRENLMQAESLNPSQLRDCIKLSETEEDLKKITSLVKINCKNPRLSSQVFADFMSKCLIDGHVESATELYNAIRISSRDVLRIYISLLYQNGHYHQIMEVMKQLKFKSHEDFLIGMSTLCKIGTETAFREAVDLAGSYREVHKGSIFTRLELILAWFAIKLGRHETAIEQLEQMYAAMPCSEFVNLLLFAKLERRQVKQAIDLLRNWLTNPDRNRSRTVISVQLMDKLFLAVNDTKNLKLKLELSQLCKKLDYHAEATEKTIQEIVFEPISSRNLEIFSSPPTETDKQFHQNNFAHYLLKLIYSKDPYMQRR